MPFTEPAERLNVSMVKSQSRRMVFRRIFADSPVTRAEIAGETGLSQGTVKTVVDEFMQSGILVERKDQSAQVGRKPLAVFLRREARTFGALYIQPDRIEMHLLDLTLQPIGVRDVYPIRRRDRLSDALRDILSGYTGDLAGRGPLTALGIVVPGVYDPDGDRVMCQIMPELEEVRLQELVSSVLGTTATIGEDVQLAALAEAGEPYNVPQPLFYLYAETGVGGSYVDEGRVLAGANQMAGEIGQMIIKEGRRLEGLVNWPGFLRELRVEAGEEPAEALRRVQNKLADPDGRVNRSVERVVDTLATALANMVCLLNPRSIVIGGPYAELGRSLFDPLSEEVLRRLIPAHSDRLTIRAAQSGEHGMIRGAAVAALEQWLDTAFVSGEPS